MVEAGPLRATLEIRRRILHSATCSASRWPTTARGSTSRPTSTGANATSCSRSPSRSTSSRPTATYEIQWGNVQRPTHRNTSWDWARFETCAQKWVDLSEGDYGVSLLNDCKYGHDIRDNVMRISLLRSPTMPDPEADQGEHRFAYSLLPHAGSWDEATVAAAYALNDPLIVAQGQRSGGRQRSGRPLVTVDRPNIVIETIKQAEDGNGMIVRLYECQRQRGPVTLTAGFPLAGAARTNLLEENQARTTRHRPPTALSDPPLRDRDPATRTRLVVGFTVVALPAVGSATTVCQATTMPPGGLRPTASRSDTHTPRAISLRATSVSDWSTAC